MYAFSPVVGWGVDRFGRVQVIVVGIGILLAACVVAGHGSQPTTSSASGVGLFLLGLGWSCTLIAGSTMVTDEVAPAERPAVQGLSDLTMNAAGAIGGVVAGVVVVFGSYGLLCAVAVVPLVALACRGRHSGVSRAFEHPFDIDSCPRQYDRHRAHRVRCGRVDCQRVGLLFSRHHHLSRRARRHHGQRRQRPREGP